MTVRLFVMLVGLALLIVGAGMAWAPAAPMVAGFGLILWAVAPDETGG